MEKKSKNKGCVQWNWSKLLKVLKGRDSVHRGSSVRVLAVFWLFSIDTTSVSCCLLELFPCILKKGTLLLDLLSHHSKPTERVIDFSGTGIKSLYTLEIQVYGSRTKRNCPEFGSSSLLQAGFLNPGEFFPIWKMPKEVEPWIWPKNSPVPCRPVGGTACAILGCPDQTELTAQWEESRALGTWAVSLSPLACSAGRA